MKKILVISPFLDSTGYGEASRRYASALDNMDGVDVVAKNLFLDTVSHQPNEFEKNLLKKDLKNINSILQITLPPHYGDKSQLKYSKHEVNTYGMFFWETSRAPSSYVKKCNSLDGCILSNGNDIAAAIEGGVNSNIISKCGIPYKKEITSNIEPINLSPIIKDKKIYYSIFQLSFKKNMEALIRGYYYAFENNNDVVLIIKTHATYDNNKRAQEHNAIAQIVSTIKKQCKLTKYPPVILISDALSEAQINYLHNIGDTFVLPSRGEAWCIPAYDAMAFGNNVIMTKGTGADEFLNQYVNYFPIEHNKERVYNMNHPGIDMYTGNEYWYEPIIESLTHQFSQAHKHSPKSDNNLLEEFSPQNIGKKLVEIILNE